MVAAGPLAVLVEADQPEAEALALGPEHRKVPVAAVVELGMGSVRHFSVVACPQVRYSVGCLVLAHICLKVLRMKLTVEAGMGKHHVELGLLPMEEEEWNLSAAESAAERTRSQRTRQDAVFLEVVPSAVT